MQVNEALQLARDQCESEATIEGMFVMRRGVGYFVQSKDEIEEKEKAIFVDMPNLEKMLFSRIPAFGGGEYSYCDRAIITGVLTNEIAQEFKYRLKNLKQFSIYKYGEPMVVL
jgi:hypothetical protein